MWGFDTREWLPSEPKKATHIHYDDHDHLRNESSIPSIKGVLMLNVTSITTTFEQIVFTKDRLDNIKMSKLLVTFCMTIDSHQPLATSYAQVPDHYQCILTLRYAPFLAPSHVYARDIFVGTARGAKQLGETLSYAAHLPSNAIVAQALRKHKAGRSSGASTTEISIAYYR
jgi:hypothetical protein